ncbi:MAG: hypothetical protein HGB12_14085 [Bacteroidetes bacterium]|nr:hypothetical protein [Bacteroidota bacterium]
MEKIIIKKNKSEILQALARGYCSDKNNKKELDSDLINDMGEELFKLAEKQEIKDEGRKNLFPSMQKYDDPLIMPGTMEENK